MPAEKVRHTRAGVLARVNAEWRALESVIERMRREDFDLQVFVRTDRESWTVKDALAHVASWERAQVRALSGLPRRAPGTARRVNETNAAVHREWHDRPWEAVVTELRSVQAAAVAALEARPDTFFSGRLRSPEWPSDLVHHVREHRLRHVEKTLMMGGR